MREKGINPLIATILLLLIALAISGLLYSWLAGYTSEKTVQASEESEKQFECSSAAFRIKSCDYVPSNGKIEFTLENTGDLDLNDWTVFVEFEDGNTDRVRDDDQNLLKRGFLYRNLSGFTANKNLKRVKFVPDNCPDVSQTTTNCK